MPPWRGAVSRCTLIVALLCHFGIAGSSSEGCPGAFRDGIATWQAAQLLKCPTLRGRSGLPGGMRTGSEWSIASLKLRGGVEDFATEEGSVGIQPEGSTWTFTDPTAAGLDVKQHADTRAQDESEDWTFQIPTPLHWDRRILVTGGCGFMGSALVDRLVLRYPTYLVVALDVLDECATLFNLETVIKRPNFFFVQADVSDGDTVSSVLERHKIDTVLHLAAQTSVDKSFKDPTLFTVVNVLGTQRLLEACRASRYLTLFLYCSTDEVCGESSDVRLSEKAPLQPTNPYSASKAAAELLVRSYAKSFALPIIVTRCVNVYGPRQFPEKLIPKFVLRLARGQACCIHGSGVARRSFIHIDDVAAAFDVVIHSGTAGEVYNIGSNETLSILEVAEQISELVRNAPADIEWVPDRLYNDAVYALDDGKLRSLGWRCTVNWKLGLERTVRWYLSYAADLDPGDPDPRSHTAPYWDSSAVGRALQPHSALDGFGQASGSRAASVKKSEVPRGE